MTSTVQIGLVAVACGLACALAGVFLVLRRMAMMADAISHSILPGLVAGYILANGPNIFIGFIGAAAAGLLTVFLVETLTKTKKVTNDTAIGLVFPTLFALGVFVISKYMANVHIDTDAVLYGEIAFAPFDTLVINGNDYGPQSLWILGGLAIVNALFLTLFYKELKLSTFDAALAASLGFLPGLLHYLLMGIVAITTVGAFSAVGAILSVAMIIVPPVTASLLTKRLPAMIGLSMFIGASSALLGFWFANLIDVSISGMVATTLGIVFGITLLAAPQQGLVAQWLRRRRQSAQFAVEMLVMHLATHQGTPEQQDESTLLHIERELNWTPEQTAKISSQAERNGYITHQNGTLNLTPTGLTLSQKILDR